MRKFLVIDTSALPDIYEKVLYAKELLRMKEVKGINEAVRLAGISRSTFYKYKDYVFSLSESTLTKKATIHFMLKHEKGILASILQILADSKANILTINQTIPLNNVATLTITLDMSQMSIGIEKLISKVKNKHNVLEVKLLGIE